MSLTCPTRRRAVRPLGTVAGRLPKVVEPLRTMATYCVQAAGLRYAGAVLQSACPHVLLAFNAPSAVCPDGDHNGHVVRGYLFSLMAHSP
jgi:hypothetical protein